MTVLIIGGLCELGSYIIKKIQNSHNDVKIDVLDKKVEFESNTHNNINQYIRCDRSNYSEFINIMKDKEYDVVIDLVAFSRSDIKVIKELFNEKISQYIFISTFEVYKFIQDITSLYEDIVGVSYIEEFLTKINILTCTDNQLYPIGKMQCEKILMDDTEIEFNYTIFRPINYYSKKDKYKHLNWIKDRVKTGEILLPMSLLKNNIIIRPIYVEELANIICESILNPATYNNTFNIAQEEVISYTNFLNKIAKYFNVDLKFIIVEDSLIKNRINKYKIPIPHNEILDINNLRKNIRYKKYSIDEWIPKVFDNLNDICIYDDTLEEEKTLIRDLTISQKYSLDILDKIEIFVEEEYSV